MVVSQFVSLQFRTEAKGIPKSPAQFTETANLLSEQQVSSCYAKANGEKQECRNGNIYFFVHDLFSLPVRMENKNLTGYQDNCVVLHYFKTSNLPGFVPVVSFSSQG